MSVRVTRVTDTGDHDIWAFTCGQEVTFHVHGDGFADVPDVAVRLLDNKGVATWTVPDPKKDIKVEAKGKKLKVKATPNCHKRGIGDLAITVTNTVTGDSGQSTFGPPVDYN
jgi:hypothetical protein